MLVKTVKVIEDYKRLKKLSQIREDWKVMTTNYDMFESGTEIEKLVISK